MLYPIAEHLQDAAKQLKLALRDTKHSTAMLKNRIEDAERFEALLPQVGYCEQDLLTV